MVLVTISNTREIECKPVAVADDDDTQGKKTENEEDQGVYQGAVTQASSDSANSTVGCLSVKKAIIVTIMLILLPFAVIIPYLLIDYQLHDFVDDLSEFCTSSNPFADAFKKTTHYTIRARPYNISNPADYVNGDTAKVEELGLYPIFVESRKDNVDFNKASGTISWDDWGLATPTTSGLCDGCSFSDEINILNFPYINILKSSRHEGMILLTSTCTTTQVGLTFSPAAVAYCTTTQMGSPTATCKCCSATPAPNATQCSTLMSATTRVGGLLSWLSMNDNGIKVDSKPSAYPLSSGTYSSIIRTMAVSELYLGTVSSLMGFLATSSAIMSPSIASTQTLYKVGNVTQDMKDACYTYSTRCPQVSAVIGAVTGGGGMAYLKSVQCDGRVPVYTELISNGMLEARALELRYLEGVSCRPFTPAVAMAAQLTMDSGSTKVCLDGSTAMPCCLRTFTSSGTTGYGVGCLVFVSGLLTEKRVFSYDEALSIGNGLEVSLHSPCADKDDRYSMRSYKGLHEFNEWYTPNSYVYPNMPWADPSVVAIGTTGAGGTLTTNRVRGLNVALREGEGFTTAFLEKQLADGYSPDKDVSVYVTYRRGEVDTKWTKKYIRDSGVAVDKYMAHIWEDTNTSLNQARQRSGQVPFPNMQSMIYTLSAPVIMSHPAFYGSGASSLLQNDNTVRGSASTAGVQLYRTRDGYSNSAAILDSPEPITEDTWNKYGKSDYSVYMDVEPATGVSLDIYVANQVNTFTWNCNPALDPSCGLLGRAYNASAPLCYASSGMHYPCSGANVFTPKAMGGKVFPLFWIGVHPISNDESEETLANVLSLRFLLSILLLALSGVCFITIIVIWFIVMKQTAGKYNAVIAPL